MPLPSPDLIEALLRGEEALRSRIQSIAERLETVGEYSRDQALVVAFDIVASERCHPTAPYASSDSLSETQTTGVTI